MSLDAFEARLQFIKLLKTLNASQASIVKVVSFAIKYGPRCGDDLWTCVVDEVEKVSLPPPFQHDRISGTELTAGFTQRPNQHPVLPRRADRGFVPGRGRAVHRPDRVISSNTRREDRSE